MSWLGDTARVLVAMPLVEWGRRVLGPERLVAKVRRARHARQRRGPLERERLRRLIAAVDARLPGGANCYRRALVEMAVDAAAAEETLYLGLKAHGGPRSGHAWLWSWPDAANAGSYDAVVEI